MNFVRTAGTVLFISTLVATCMYALTTTLKPSLDHPSRLLLVGNGNDEDWQRTVAGAQAAAHELGVELVVETPMQKEPIDQQVSIVRRINAAAYDGVAISPAEPKSQIEFLNDLANQTNLVTVDRDDCKLKRLCHIGYSQTNTGQLIARLVSEHLRQPGKVVVLATTFSDDVSNSNVCERLASFRAMWRYYEQNTAIRRPVVEVKADSYLPETLVDPEVTTIVALDSKAAEAALKALAVVSDAQPVSVFSFGLSDVILDAIEDGRVCSAIFEDPYHTGFNAIRRLAAYRASDKDALPVPGYGSDFLVSEVVTKENVAGYRRRTRS